jgi:hypothetical protein
VQLKEYFVDLVDVPRTRVDQSHGELAEAVVVQRQDDKQQLQAFIFMSANGDSTTLPYLQVLLRSLRLPACLRPTRAVALTALPLTCDGKADRSTLQTIKINTTRSIEVVQHASSYRPTQPLRVSVLESTEQAILSIWEKCLPYIASISTISATSNFFALGGNTTLLSHVLDQMRSKFKETLMLTDLVHNPTLQGMTTVAMNKTSIFSLGGTAIDWKAETSLPMISSEKIDPEKVKTDQNMVVLLTGAAGFFGRAILGCLITAPEVLLIHCIAIRSPDEVNQHEKVVNHTGNLTHPCFGTSQSDWR